MENLSFDQWLSEKDLSFWGMGKHRVTAAQFFEQMQTEEGAVLLDVRTPEEAQYLALPFSLHIPANELPQRWQEIPTDKLVAAFCSGTTRATVAYTYLQTKGLANVRILLANYAELVEELKPGKVLKMAGKNQA